MTEQTVGQIIDAPALDEEDVDPESLVGEEIPEENDLNPDTFDDEDEDES
jgi:hypothetical protein